MGGDQGCAVAVDGVRLALQASSHIAEIHLVGRQDEIDRAISRARLSDNRVRIVHASEVLTMEDNPLSAIRKKKDSSLARGIELVKNGRADALISAVNTGALIAASTLA